MADVFNVTGSWDEASYTSGQTITGTISGGDVLTTTSQGQAGPLSGPISTADTAAAGLT